MTDYGNLYNREARRLEEDSIEFMDAMKQWVDMCYFDFQKDENPKQLLDRLFARERQHLSTKLSELKAAYSHAGKEHTWICINPDPKNTTLESLAESMEKLVSKHKMFETYLYCIEQNVGNAELRPHVHMMIEHTIGVRRPKPHRIREIISQFFSIPANFVETKYFKRDVMFQEHFNYIQGNKKSEKQENVQKDIEDLAKSNLQKVYGNIISA